VKSPARTIPLSTVLGTALTGLLYLVVCSGMILLMPADAIAHSNAPFGVFVERFWAHGPANLVALFAAISALGALNGWVLVQGEMPLAMARDGAFPSWFAAVSARGTPVRALLVSSLLASLLVAANYSRSMSEMFIFMGLLSTAITLIVYFATMLAAIREYARGRFGRAPWVLVLAGIGTLYSLWAISGVGFGSAKWSFLLFVSGAPVYYLMRRSRAAQQTAE
jgi:APA family basic amino acid/polyamine antiporter